MVPVQPAQRRRAATVRALPRRGSDRRRVRALPQAPEPVLAARARARAPGADLRGPDRRPLAGAAQALASFLGLSRPFPDPFALLAEPINAGVVPRHRGAFAVARRLGGYLMRHDVNWPSRLAKRLGVREWFGREGGVATLDPNTRHRVGARFLEDTIRLGKSLDRNLVGFGASVRRMGRVSRPAAEPAIGPRYPPGAHPRSRSRSRGWHPLSVVDFGRNTYNQ